MRIHRARTSMFTTSFVATFVVIVAPAWAGVINEDLKLLASDGEDSGQFGISIAIDDGIVAVGARGHRDNGSRSGAAYLFDASTGAQIAKLLSKDGAAGDYFGFSIAIDSGVVAIGAIEDDDNGWRAGSAYLFDVSTGAQIAKLLPEDGAEDQWFGSSIAIDNGIVAVGARGDDENGNRSGSAYLFDASTGAQITKILPDDGGGFFGFSIAMDNGVIAVGSIFDNDNGASSGSAYLFDASDGAEIAKLLPNDGAENDWFGYSIAIDNGIVAVGSRLDDDNGEDSGSAYLFDASNGAQIAKLLPSDGAEVDWFGYSIAIDNGIVAVGSRRHDHNARASGSAYLFDASTGAQIAELLASDGGESNWFGSSIAIKIGVVAVGAPGDDDNGSGSGSAYVFDVGDLQFCARDPEWICDGDVDGDRQVNPVDSGLVQAAFGSVDDQDLCNYDLDCDGQINPVDSGIVQSLFGTCQEPRGVCP